MAKRNFGELEQEILHILRSGEKKTVKDVHSILGDQNKYNTIMTVMVRLANKGIIARERNGLQYAYWLASPIEKSPSFLAQFKKKIFGVKTSVMVNYLIESANDISDDDLADMERMIEKAKARRR
jgi:predicted transcriptional regulator